MGRYTKLIIVTKTSQLDTNLNKYWAQEHIQMEMGKCYDELFNNIFDTPSNCYLISVHDGNTSITEDRYDEPLKELPIADALILFEALRNNSECNRWYKVFYEILVHFIEEYRKYDEVTNLYVLRYDW